MPEPLPEIDKLWDFGDPATSEARFREAIATLPMPEKAEAMTQLARALGLQRKFNEAHTVLDEVQAKFAQTPPIIKVRCALERGRLFNDVEHTSAARGLFTTAHILAHDAKLEYLAVDALHMLAIIEPPEQSLRWHEKAIAAANAATDPKARRWLASLHNNYGWTLSELGRNDEALAVLEEALRLRQEMGQPGTIRIARFCVAKVKRLLGRIDEALAEQRQLMIDEHGQPADGVPVWVKTNGFGNEEIGECLLAQGHADDARPYFAIAYDVLSKDPWLAPREPQRIARLKELGGVA